MSVQEHRQEAPSVVKCLVVTVSDTRTEETDKSGQLISRLLVEKGYIVTDYQIVKDEYSEVQRWIINGSERSDVDAVLINGGTGIALRDTTHEAVKDSLDKEIPGFGELFRYLSYVEDIGTASILSRAIAGVRGSTAVFSMPGSSGAVSLAMNRIILPELAHVIREIRKDRK
ncbi:MogA/MoaB family molybdenum cofactor biosynthesis protein [Bacillus alkalicellulosilyticus]|uniref:MogA/MoaB family molybdenum cofactor biosynthesis protein n=1 Tax=Alkalihalobacterium alkalicellulosilyticum TaxID=1912214 RepID=UPI000998039D|nr:molybdenum cofactor biosynthesis protein B [Bacillus alkalicellulosilyticus]